MKVILTFGLSVVSILFSSLTFGQQPISNFTAVPVSVCQGQPVTFTNTSTTNGGTAITDYAWDFGDGFSDSIPNTTHI